MKPNFTPVIYGAPPKDLGCFELDTSEMMFWLYCPIKMPASIRPGYSYPAQLAKFEPLVREVFADVYATRGGQAWRDSYVYLSVKITHVTPYAPGNRPGWHSDGFLTDDLNYIWCDRNPTEFCITDEPWFVHADHATSMKEFAMIASTDLSGTRLEHGKVNHLYRLDQSVIHRVSENVEAGKRAFIKVSVSDKPYIQLGNSINHGLPEHPRPSLDRKADRNCPQGNR